MMIIHSAASKNSIHNDLVVMPIHSAASGVPFHDVLLVCFGHAMELTF
jgi:hypothetical protein